MGQKEVRFGVYKGWSYLDRVLVKNRFERGRRYNNRR